MEIHSLRYNTRENYLSVPFFIHLEVTENCPLSCPQCYCNLSNGNEMQWDLCKKIIMQIKQLCVSRILITGGEPLVYSHIVEAIREISENHIISEVASSGVGLTDQFAISLKSSGLNRLHISLNGSTKEIHNLSRSNFEETIVAIQIAKKNGLWCGINWVARKDNAKDFGKLIKIAQNMNVDMITILSNKPDKDGIIQGELSYKDFLYIAELAKPYYDKKWISVDLCYSEMREAVSGHKCPSVIRGCTAGRLFFDIGVDGSVTPCRHHFELRDTFSNIDDYWNYNDNLLFLRSKGMSVSGCRN